MVHYPVCYREIVGNNKVNTFHTLKILLIAYDCSPVRSHASGAAWQIISRLAEHHELWVVSEEMQYRREIEDYLASHTSLARKLHFEYIAKDFCVIPTRQRPVLPFRAVIAYKRWLKRAHDRATEIHNRVKLDLVHHLRGNSFRAPGECWQLPIPFIWGPVGGTIGVPWRMLSSLGWRDSVLHAVRNSINFVELYRPGTVRQAARKASTVLVQSALDQKRFLSAFGVQTVIGHEQNAELSLLRQHAYDGRRELRICWAGRMVPLKGLELFVDAVSASGVADRMKVDVFGDGPEQAKCISKANRLGLSERIRWHGWQPPGVVVAAMQASDVFVCTFLYAAESTTTLQALSCALPVVCLRHGISSDIVNSSCGFTVRPLGRSHASRGIAGALRQLVENPHLVSLLSAGAAKRANEFSWEQLTTSILDIYKKAVV